MKATFKSLIVLLMILFAVQAALAGQWSHNFETKPGSSGLYYDRTFEKGEVYRIAAKVRPATWDPSGVVAGMVPIRMIIFDPDGNQLYDSGPHLGKTTYVLRPYVSGTYQVQVLIGAPLGALGNITIKW